MTVTAEERKQIKEKGYADIGGLKKNKYWTPDGREIIAVPNMRTYIVKNEGKVIEQGVRDANLDNGWLLQKPQVLKPHCPYCGKWHDTQEEIEECKTKRQAFNKKWEKMAAKMRKEQTSDADNLKEKVEGLEADISQIKDMLAQLLKKGE